MQDNKRFLDSVIFWGSKNPCVSLEHVHDSPKMNLFCALSKERVYGPFFFMETTITSIVFLDMLQQFLIPQLDDSFITLEKCESISTPISQVSGFVELRR
jgi:hypothetical protein